MSKIRFHSKTEFYSVSSIRRSIIRPQEGTADGKCFQMPPSLLFPWKSIWDSDLASRGKARMAAVGDSMKKPKMLASTPALPKQKLPNWF